MAIMYKKENVDDVLLRQRLARANNACFQFPFLIKTSKGILCQKKQISVDFLSININ